MTFASGISAYANDFELKIEEKAPPEELSDVVKSDIEHKSYQLSDGDGLFFEIWLTKEIKVGEEKDTHKNTLDTVDSISLLGAMVVHREERYDFREDPIDPGLYVLRLSLQPQDGNHMGTAPFDTFAILIPHEMDKMVLEFMDHDEMVDIASEPTAAEHPPILSLQPMESAEGEFPSLAEHDEEEWFLLNLQLPGKVGDKEVKIPVHLIFEGIGDL
jgi:hypothetical protein